MIAGGDEHRRVARDVASAAAALAGVDVAAQGLAARHIARRSVDPSKFPQRDRKADSIDESACYSARRREKTIGCRHGRQACRAPRRARRIVGTRSPARHHGAGKTKDPSSSRS